MGIGVGQGICVSGAPQIILSCSLLWNPLTKPTDFFIFQTRKIEAQSVLETRRAQYKQPAGTEFVIWYSGQPVIYSSLES